jgi:hypothetical protein
MSRRSFWKVLAFAAALAVMAIISTPAVVIAEQVPFKAKLAGNAHLTPTDDPFVLLNHETGEGEATHLGQFQWEDDEVATFVPGGLTVVALFTMTAANGDELYGEFSSVGSFDEDGNLVIQATYNFVGGSGRFIDATGSGTIDAIAFLSPGLPFVGTFNGTIDF